MIYKFIRTCLKFLLLNILHNYRLFFVYIYIYIFFKKKKKKKKKKKH